MIYDVMKSINNFFEDENGYHYGTWEIKDGLITLPFLLNNQYFRIIGSVFNDGVYKYDANLELADETFDGTIVALKPPKAFMDLVAEIQAFNDKYGTITPYTSESFLNYSYSKASGTNGTGQITWMDAYRSKLNKWRKL